MQINASVGGECASDAALGNKQCSLPTSRLGATIADKAMQVALTVALESAFASGWVGVDLCSAEVAQQVLLAQQPGLQAC
jgi:hypothetical protein